jgi:hypothetical protein
MRINSWKHAISALFLGLVDWIYCRDWGSVGNSKQRGPTQDPFHISMGGAADIEHKKGHRK